MMSLVGRIASACRNAVESIEERIAGSRERTRKRAPGVRYARLRLQTLEERLAPAVYHWTGAGANNSVHIRE